MLRRPSRRKHLSAVKAQLHGLAVMAGREPQPYTTRIPEARGPRKPSQGVTEAQVNGEIREYVKERDDVTLWRNNRGQIETANGRLVYGVGPNGSSDWLGYQRIVVTPDLVGCTLAVFLAVEAKRPGADATDDQMRFIERVQLAGGISGVAHSRDELEGILK